MKPVKYAKICVSLLLCLALCAVFLAVPAFAESSIVIIKNSSVGTESASSFGNILSSGISASNSNSQSVSLQETPVTVRDSSTAFGNLFLADGETLSSPVSGNRQNVVIINNANTAASAGTQTAAASASSDYSTLSALQTAVFQRVNEVRAQNGLSQLSYSARLQSAADTRASESAVLFSHNRPDGTHCSTAVQLDYSVTGENLIQVTSEYATADIMVETWLNSTTHRANLLLADFTETAIGVYVQNGTTFVAQVFLG